MARFSHAVLVAGLSVLCCAASASADTLRCQSVNGNLNCAGSSGASCQTIDGRTVCISGHGDVVQSFGNGASRHPRPGVTEDPGDRDGDMPEMKERLEQYGPGGHWMQLQRDGNDLHVRSDWLSIDRN
jgi:hypothetical protein